jgi:hypothetical protein
MMRLLAREVPVEIDGTVFVFKRLTHAERAEALDLIRGVLKRGEESTLAEASAATVTWLALALLRIDGLEDAAGRPVSVVAETPRSRKAELLGLLDADVVSMLSDRAAAALLRLPGSAEGN